MDADRGPLAAMRHVVDVPGTERDGPAAGQPAAQPATARRAVLLEQAALGDSERPGRAAVVVPVGILPAFPGKQPDVASIRAVQRQVPADVGVVDDEIRPELAAGRDLGRDGSQRSR